MKKSLVMIAILTLSLMLAVGCAGGSSTPTSTQSPASTAKEALSLAITEPVDEAIVNASRIMVSGKTVADAVVSINGNIVSVDLYGNFSELITLELGPNLIEIVASDFYGNSTSELITVICNP